MLLRHFVYKNRGKTFPPLPTSLFRLNGSQCVGHSPFRRGSPLGRVIILLPDFTVDDKAPGYLITGGELHDQGG